VIYVELVHLENKTPEESLNYVRAHVESFPVIDAHYSRKDTKRNFLVSDLNITMIFNC